VPLPVQLVLPARFQHLALDRVLSAMLEPTLVVVQDPASLVALIHSHLLVHLHADLVQQGRMEIQSLKHVSIVLQEPIQHLLVQLLVQIAQLIHTHTLLSL